MDELRESFQTLSGNIIDAWHLPFTNNSKNYLVKFQLARLKGILYAIQCALWNLKHSRSGEISLLKTGIPSSVPVSLL